MSNLVNHILLADDDTDDIFMFKLAVQEICPTVQLSVAYDGVMLSKTLLNISFPDAIFLDINMPRKNGKECLVELRAQSIYAEVPIIILSTSKDSKDIDFCMAHGADHYIIKPPNFEDLKKVVKDLCEGKLSVKTAVS